LEGTTTFGWGADEMPFQLQRPADFDDFWKAAIAKIDSIPPEPTCDASFKLSRKEIDTYNTTSAALPENYDPEGNRYDEVEVYRVRFSSYGGKAIEGWYAKPVGAGPFPALLVLPGAGNAARPAPVEHARHGYAALDIQVHGFPVNATHYPEPPADNTSCPEGMGHYAIYLHAIQAVRALKQLPGVDPDQIAVLGGSQGGRLTCVVAALEPSVKAAVAAITHYAYLPWLHWTEWMNQNGRSGGQGFGIETVESKQKNRVDNYLDVLNFAPLIRCPVLMNAGLIDPVSPPTGIFAAYRLLRCKKEMIPLPNAGHDWSPAFDRYAWDWLKRTLNERPSRACA